MCTSAHIPSSRSMRPAASSAEKTVAATTAGHAEAVMWARERFGAEVVWAIEDCRHLSARLERDLFDCGAAGGAGAAEVDGPDARPRRAPAASPIRSMRWRSLAGFLREPDLPVASHDEVSRELKLLVDRREVLVGTTHRDDQPAVVAGPRARPRSAPPRPVRWTWPSIGGSLGDWLETQSGIVAELARDELADITRLDRGDQRVGQTDR